MRKRAVIPPKGGISQRYLGALKKHEAPEQVGGDDKMYRNLSIQETP